MREYSVRQAGANEWVLKQYGNEECDGLCTTVLYTGCMLGVTEILNYLEEPSTPEWAAHVASWEDAMIDAFLSRLAVRPPARRIDRIKRVVTLISEGECQRPENLR